MTNIDNGVLACMADDMMNHTQEMPCSFHIRPLFRPSSLARTRDLKVRNSIAVVKLVLLAVL